MSGFTSLSQKGERRKNKNLKEEASSIYTAHLGREVKWTKKQEIPLVSTFPEATGKKPL